MGIIADISGQLFGRLTVRDIAFVDKHRKIHWNCVCSCGRHVIIIGASLRNGRTTSCGCLQKELLAQRNFKHGFGNTKLEEIRSGMIQRCSNPNYKYYYRYGGRGIKICNDWLQNSKTFFDWAMKTGYTEGLTVDRIDNDGDYNPDNCRWATRKEQANNTRRNILITVNEKTLSLSEWCRLLGLNYSTILGRINRGWDKKEAILAPVKSKKKG